MEKEENKLPFIPQFGTNIKEFVYPKIEEAHIKVFIQKHLLEVIRLLAKEKNIKVNESEFKINVELVGEETTKVIPLNLYSLLCISGIVVPYFVVKDKTEYFVDGLGTLCCKETPNGVECGIMPITPVESIKIDISLNDGSIKPE